MNTLNTTTVYNPKSIKPNWVVFDASEYTLGRLASKIADRLIGKNKTSFTPNHDISDKIIVLNSGKIKVTGKKLTDKIYYRHSNYPGGLKSESLEKRLVRRPSDVLRDAVKGMLPINRLRDSRLNNLYIYEGEVHPHQGQVK